MIHYAIMHNDGRIIASGRTVLECSNAAKETGVWDEKPGTGAPYYLTTIPPTDRCHSCEVIYINGVRCHENGCPDAWKDEIRKCKWCGGDFKPETRHQTCCCHTCIVAYDNINCNCEECNPPEE